MVVDYEGNVAAFVSREGLALKHPGSAGQATLSDVAAELQILGPTPQL